MKPARRGRRRWSVRIATIAGIDVRVHFSMLLVMWLAQRALQKARL